MTPNSVSAPRWIESPPPPGSFRAIFKWGDPHTFKHPNLGLVRLLQDRLGIAFRTEPTPEWLGLRPLPEALPIPLEGIHLNTLRDLVGAENVRTDPFSRVRASYGAGMVDQLRLRLGILENLPAAVLSPAHRMRSRQLWITAMPSAFHSMCTAVAPRSPADVKPCWVG